MDDALDGTGAEFGVIALVGEPADGGGGDAELYAVGGEHLLHAFYLQADDFLNLVAAEGREHDYLVDAVEELGADGALEHLEHLVAGLVYGLLAVLFGHLGEIVADE